MKFDPSNPQYRSVRSKFAAAFKEPANLIGLSSALALSIGTLNPLPLLVGIVAEAAYMLFVPDTKWFLKRLESKFDEEVRAHRQALRERVFVKIRFEIQEHFIWLESARSQIEQESPIQDTWFREALRKLDFLMEKYLEFAEREADFLNYLIALFREVNTGKSKQELNGLTKLANFTRYPTLPKEAEVDPAAVQEVFERIKTHYESEIESLVASIESEKVYATKEILVKRRDVLGRRREFIIRLGDMMVNLRHQMELIAETFGLISDEMRARSPEQVLADIDDVVSQATTLTDALDLLTPDDQVVARTEKEQ